MEAHDILVKKAIEQVVDVFIEDKKSEIRDLIMKKSDKTLSRTIKKLVPDVLKELKDDKMEINDENIIDYLKNKVEDNL